MKIETARIDDRMAPAGKAILRSLQNDSLPIVDLVIRESFQNSLDATLQGETETKIDVSIDKIKISKVAHHFEGIDTRLHELFPNNSTMVAIRDSNTSGLTGEFNTTNKKVLNQSNIYKLIYGLNMNQEKTDAGGSWGLGKTSFFRMGCGIVIYYSRVKLDNGEYEERLAACLIEDSDKDNAIMPNNDRGIAWWGEKKTSEIHDKSFPVTDGEFITRFLGDFNIIPYINDETGTTIIVPFIDESNITMQSKTSGVFPWESSLKESIELAIQRWYFPRIGNKNYQEYTGNSVLITSVNGSRIVPKQFTHTFKWFQKLYSYGVSTDLSKNDDFEGRIETKEIFLDRVGMVDRTTPIGHLAYVKLTIDDLKTSKHSGFISPTKYIGDYTNVDERPYGANILAYVRKPGMIVEYVVNDKDWMQGLSVEENTYILAIFIPNSSGNLHSRYHPTYSTLESYLRDTENADHATWIDKNNGTDRITIVNRIKKTVSKIMVAEIIDKDVVSNKRTSVLGRHFGQKFLPVANFGHTSAIGKRRSETGSTYNLPGLHRPLISINNVSFISENIREIEFEATLLAESNNKIYFEVSTSQNRINQEKWEKDFEGKIPFPFRINELTISKWDRKEINTISDRREKHSTSLIISNSFKKRISIEGKIELEINNLNIEPQLSIKAKKIDNKEEDN